ncbi:MULTISPECIES: hypothetical protein [unclassified Clostridioides]|uniref:hypothetical protein n=1 Tax=unclassified Clostridioides TaxID=2635829 RepID=UPI001D0C1680|nr:hypothetical protein [Clostridioides sp. ES-S-0049-03]MCC0672769.1 hypothetical protein [Clostridioides sp. ES-S-0145-01]MCC0676675.1 hypothetical protein [Clostridioides sp. ES-W-0018-02]MCC0711942.1 hypothetical protein [Clostridioides sp. ES-W-0017-02]MCC0762936.1 hypothetical protein [Clostridioides sp. ES-S-0006-03]UDN57554.1 hypothetical protein JJC01_15430 [Clostridioides sp. ES-S-0010-02]
MEYLLKKSSLKKDENESLGKYKELLNRTENNSRSIILLVPNNNTRIRYERSLELDYSEELKITTYIGFVKKELLKYWALIIEKCEGINKKSISPTFISNSLSEYLIIKKVKEKRVKEGYFEDITGTNKSIAKSIITNISKSAFNLIDFDFIGEKIYSSKKNRNSIYRFSYTQMDEIISYYINTLLSNSMLDNALSVYLYNNYLLNDEFYLKNLLKELRYIVVDSLENSSNAEVDFIEKVSSNALESYIFFDFSKDYSVFNNIDMGYINEKIISKIKFKEEINFEKSNIKIEDLYLLPSSIELNQSSQLYNEMLDLVSEKVVTLIESGVSPKDIAIISPINNTILEYQIRDSLKEKNIDVFNTKKDKKAIDYPYGNALVVATCIFYGYLDFIKDEEYISFLETLLDINRIKAFKIFKETRYLEVDKIGGYNQYRDILQYIEEKKKSDIKIHEFLIQFYIDKMLNLKDGKKNVGLCKQIITESESFSESANLLGLKEEKIFIEALKTTINDYYSVIDIEELKSKDKIVITTPYSYISSNIDRSVQILVDIGSNSWNMKIEKDISNLIVLRKSFEEKKIYTNEMEEYYKKYYLYNTIYNLLLSAKKVYAYKSEYTINGYIQESMLYSILLKLSHKGDKIYD